MPYNKLLFNFLQKVVFNSMCNLVLLLMGIHRGIQGFCRKVCFKKKSFPQEGH